MELKMTVEELKKFINEVPDDIILHIEIDEGDEEEGEENGK